MERWLTGVMTVLVVVSLTACTPTTEKQKKETTAAVATKSQEDMMLPSTSRASDKVPDLNVMPIAMISVYHGGGGSLVQDMDPLDVEGLDTQLLVDRLIEYGVLTGGAKVLSFDVKGKDENAAGAPDLSQAESVEGCSDKMLPAEISNTFTENFELSKFRLKVNGANHEDDDIKQGDSDYLIYNADYESAEQIGGRGSCL